jgi:hypothetical protein
MIAASEKGRGRLGTRPGLLDTPITPEIRRLTDSGLSPE